MRGAFARLYREYVTEVKTGSVWWGAALHAIGGAELVGASVCGSEAACQGNRCNHPPVALINDGRAEILVPGNQTGVRLTGQSSIDPDGDVLAFQWQTDGVCTIEAGANESEVFITASTTACVVTLTVDDGDESAVASVNLLPSSTGTHVRPSVGCVPGPVDLKALGEQGTPNAPWCSLADGLEAARLTGNREVRLAIDGGLEAGVRVDTGIVVSGGWVDGPGASWVRGTLRSRIGVVPGLPLEISNGRVEQLSLSLLSPCSGDCELVEAPGGRVTLANTELLSPGSVLQRFEALRASSAEEFLELTLRDVSIATADDATESVAVSVDGGGVGGWVEIFDSTIELGDAAQLAVGVRTHSISGLKLVNSTIATRGDNGAEVFGVRDGQRARALPCSNGDPVCGGGERSRDSRGRAQQHLLGFGGLRPTAQWHERVALHRPDHSDEREWDSSAGG